MNPAPRESGKHRIRRSKLPAIALATALVGGGAFAASQAWAGTSGSGTTIKTSTGTRLSVRFLGERVARALKAGKVSGTVTPSGGAAVRSAASPRIIGGTTTSITTAPWMVQLWYDEGDGSYSFCGGTLVAPTKVLTAAHCVHGLDWHDNGVVVGGTTALWDSTNGKAVRVWKQWSHPSYSDSTIQNDIAVLTLDAPLPYTTAKLADATDTASYTEGTVGTVYGWGLTSSGGDLSDQLRKVSLPVVADGTCQPAMDAITSPDSLYTPGKMFCAGKPGTGSSSTTVATCHGDSGGPFVVNGRIAGIVSWGAADCIQKGGYDVYTKVSTFAATAQAAIAASNGPSQNDWSRDGKADLLVRQNSARSGQGYAYLGTTLRYRSSTGTGWQNFNKVVQGDFNQDGNTDLIMRSTKGVLYWRNENLATHVWKNTQLATGWGSVRQIVAPGDLNGDKKPDLLTVDGAGKVWVYPGKGNGTFGSRFQIGSGFGGYTQIVGHGDFTGDGRADLIGRTSAGAVYLWAGKGNGYFNGRKTVAASGFSTANAMAAVGDVNGDGRADLLIRFKSGSLYLYPGKGNGSFGARVAEYGKGWNAFTILG